METFKEFQRVYILAADTNYLVESVDIADGALTIAHQPDVPRNVTITVIDANQSISAGLITITGTNWSGAIVVEVFDLTNGLVQVGTQTFSTILSCIVSDLAGEEAGDTIIIGIGGYAQVIEGRCLLHNIIVNGGAGTVGPYTIINGVSGTTANVGILKANIAVGTYYYDILMSLGIRILIEGAETITVTYKI